MNSLSLGWTKAMSVVVNVRQINVRRDQEIILLDRLSHRLAVPVGGGSVRVAVWHRRD